MRQPEVAWRPQQLYHPNQRGLAVRGGGLCEVPVEGKVDIGLKLGFNYWISGENYGRIMTTDVRDLVLFVLSKSENVATTNQPCLPWVCEKSLNGCRRVVLACASALPMLYAESDFFDGKAPHLECWSRVPTRHEFHQKQRSGSLELKASPAFLLWKDLPPLPQKYLLSMTPTELFASHTIFFEAVRGDQRRSPETIVLNGRSRGNIPIEGKCGPILSREEDGEVAEREEGPLVRLKLCEGEAFGLQSGSKAKWVLYEITGGCSCTGNLTVGEWMKEEPDGSTTISRRLVLILEWLSKWLPEELELVRRDGSELIFHGRDTRDTASEKQEVCISKNVLGGQLPLTLTMTKALPENVLQKEFRDSPAAMQQEIQRTTDIPQGGAEQEDTKDSATKMESTPSNILLADPPFQNLEEHSLSHFNRRRFNIPVSLKEEEEGYVTIKPIGVNEASEDSEEGELTCDEVLLPPLRAPLPLVAIDCEMVYTKLGLELARVSIVDRSGKPLYDEFVKPSEPVLSYNTEFSGISEENLSGRWPGSLFMCAFATCFCFGEVRNSISVCSSAGIRLC